MVNELGGGGSRKNGAVVKMHKLVIHTPMVDAAFWMNPCFFVLCADSDRKRWRYRRGVRAGRRETDCQACCRRRGKQKENAATVDRDFSAKGVGCRQSGPLYPLLSSCVVNPTSGSAYCVITLILVALALSRLFHSTACSAKNQRCFDVLPCISHVYCLLWVTSDSVET